MLAPVHIRCRRPPGMQFELASTAPSAALTGLVREYVGWFDWSSTPTSLRELPSGDIPLIVYFEGHPGGRDAFTAGLHDTAVIATFTGPVGGVQANLTALGARLFFDRPLANLTNRTESLDDLLGPSIKRLQSELHDARTWEARFAALDREIASRILTARRPRAELTWACEQLVRSAGQVSVAALSSKIGWSGRHFTRQFTREIGTTPKAFARVLRFGSAVRLLTQRSERLADIALDCGYYDQAHFTRDFRELAGVTPTELLASRRPAESGFSASASHS
jgi:AraC-like DNA-binding protein